MSQEAEERVADDNFTQVVNDPTQVGEEADIPSNTQNSLATTGSETSTPPTDNPDLTTMGAVSSGFLDKPFVLLIEMFSCPGDVSATTAYVLANLGIGSVSAFSKTFTEFTDLSSREYIFGECVSSDLPPHIIDEAIGNFAKLRPLLASMLICKGDFNSNLGNNHRFDVSSQTNAKDINVSESQPQSSAQQCEARGPNYELEGGQQRGRVDAKYSGKQAHAPRPKPYSRPPKTKESAGSSHDANLTLEKAQTTGGVNPNAFSAACLFMSVSDTFKFRDIPAYDDVDVADFILRSLRNRARPDITLRRVVSFIFNSHTFDTYAMGRIRHINCKVVRAVSRPGAGNPAPRLLRPPCGWGGHRCSSPVGPPVHYGFVEY